MYKFKKNLIPGELNMFNTNEDVHSYDTRQRTNLHIPRGRTALVYKIFKYKGIQLWNDM